MENNGETTRFDIGMFAGLAIGMALGLLFAPQPGKQTRDTLREKVLELSRTADEIAEKLK
jgi:gas vesicle protein